MEESPQTLKNRMIRAAKLEVALYEEVEADTSATGQALQAVLIASLAAAIGTAIVDASVGVLVFRFVSAVFGWLAWSVMAYWLGTTIFKGPHTSATLGELLRTIGFANSPMVLMIFIFVPLIGFLIWVIVPIWTLIAGVIAVRQALDFSTARALGVCVVGWIIYALISSLVVILVM